MRADATSSCESACPKIPGRRAAAATAAAAIPIQGRGNRTDRDQGRPPRLLRPERRDTLSRVTAIRGATWDDFDEIVDLLDARSRAAFGVSEVKAEYVRQRWEMPGYDMGWAAVDGERIVGYAALDGTQDMLHAATDPGVGDALLEQVAARARGRSFDHLAVTAVPEDVP